MADSKRVAAVSGFNLGAPHSVDLAHLLNGSFLTSFSLSSITQYSQRSLSDGLKAMSNTFNFYGLSPNISLMSS